MKKLTLLLLLLFIIPVSAGEKCPCPGGFLAKYECESDNWVFTEGQDIISLTGNCQEVSWTSEVEISYVMAKAGQDCIQCVGGYSGTVIAGEHELSHLSFCREQATAITIVHFGAHSLRETVIAWLVSLLQHLTSF